jgi:ATP-dependent helicase/nuclease subunit A
MAGSDVEVKREQEDGSSRHGGEVRVMTAHGAKGLEAPIVFLPDVTTRAGAMGGPLLQAEGGFLWAPRKADDCPASARARMTREAEATAESLRLLYVAMTRARDRLVICGVKTADHRHRDSWHDLMARAFDEPRIAAASRMVADDDGAQITRFGVDPRLAGAEVVAAPAVAATPAWVGRFAPSEPLARRYASPSSLVDADTGPAPSPLAETHGLGRWRRGLLIHRLLQLLPDIAPTGRDRAAEILLRREPDLTPSHADEIAQAALAVLADARFEAVFGPGSRAEAAIAGGAADLPPGLRISGRIDRLVVEADRILVVDFKTNRPAPGRIEQADRAYLIQMAVYVAVLREIYPGRRIEAALVWTDGPKLMAIPENIIVETLADLRAGVDRGGAAA